MDNGQCCVPISFFGCALHCAQLGTMCLDSMTMKDMQLSTATVLFCPVLGTNRGNQNQNQWFSSGSKLVLNCSWYLPYGTQKIFIT